MRIDDPSAFNLEYLDATNKVAFKIFIFTGCFKLTNPTLSKKIRATCTIFGLSEARYFSPPTACLSYTHAYHTTPHAGARSSAAMLCDYERSDTRRASQNRFVPSGCGEVHGRVCWRQIGLRSILSPGE